jgi:hypothetical protein
LNLETKNLPNSKYYMPTTLEVNAQILVVFPKDCPLSKMTKLS